MDSQQTATITLQRIIAIFMSAVLFMSLVIWVVTNRPHPAIFRLATAEEGGLYYKLGKELASHLAEASGRKLSEIKIESTRGSTDNYELLTNHQVEAAIIQSGTTPLQDLKVVTPLYREYVHLIARHDRNIQSVRDLQHKTVILGPPGSGMRRSAQQILERYELDPQTDLHSTDQYFLELLTDPTLDAAIVTTGLMNPDLQELLKTGEFDLIPIRDAEALAIHHAHFTPAIIPRGFYKEGPPIPDRNITTVATTAILVVHEDARDKLVNDLLTALYENRWQPKTCTLFSPKEIAAWSTYPLHPVTQHYFDPYGGIGLLADFMESMAALKELFFALGAGLYLLWQLRKRKRDQISAAEMHRQKEHLDTLLNQTLVIERAQITTHDPVELKKYLDEVTQIKLKALDELTVEELRGDRMFSIFLMQCANLIRKIQSKITDLNRN